MRAVMAAAEVEDDVIEEERGAIGAALPAPARMAALMETER